MRNTNPTLKILIGPSASGKSTWAKTAVTCHDKWCIVSRDDYRYAWQNRGVVDSKLEQIISVQVRSAIQSLIAGGYNVIYDATNLKKKYIMDIANYVRYTAIVEFQLFDVPKETCIERDAKRERSVGADVIERQYKDFLELKETFDFEPIEPTHKKHVEPKFDFNKDDAIIVDIDGTLAHTSGKRSHYDMTKVALDDCDIVIKEILNRLSKYYVVIVLTGRDASCSEETFYWLQSNEIKANMLLMRKKGDTRKDFIVKEELYWQEIEPKFNVRFVLDDRDTVVEMWRNLGLKCLQVQPGNF